MVIFLIIVSQSISFSLDFAERGNGSTKEKAEANAKWNVVTKAMIKIFEDKSQDEKILDIFKAKFEKNPERYLPQCKLTSVKTDNGQYLAEAYCDVNMSAVQTDVSELMSNVSAERGKPSIAIYVQRNEDKQFIGYLAEKFKKNGYTFFDYETQKLNYMVKLNKADNSKYSEMELFQIIAKNAGVNYLVEIPISKLENIGQDKTTGESQATFSYEIKVVDTSSDASEALASARDSVSHSAFNKVEEFVYAKAANVVFPRINSQILDSWSKSASFYKAYINGIDRQLFKKVVNILIAMTGDDNPNISEPDTIAGYSITFKLKKEINYKDVSMAEDKIMEIGITEDKYQISVSNKKAQIKKL